MIEKTITRETVVLQAVRRQAESSRLAEMPTSRPRAQQPSARRPFRGRLNIKPVMAGDGDARLFAEARKKFESWILPLSDSERGRIKFRIFWPFADDDGAFFVF